MVSMDGMKYHTEIQNRLYTTYPDTRTSCTELASTRYSLSEEVITIRPTQGRHLPQDTRGVHLADSLFCAYVGVGWQT